MLGGRKCHSLTETQFTYVVLVFEFMDYDGTILFEQVIILHATIAEKPLVQYEVFFISGCHPGLVRRLRTVPISTYYYCPSAFHPYHCSILSRSFVFCRGLLPLISYPQALRFISSYRLLAVSQQPSCTALFVLPILRRWLGWFRSR